VLWTQVWGIPCDSYKPKQHHPLGRAPVPTACITGPWTKRASACNAEHKQHIGQQAVAPACNTGP